VHSFISSQLRKQTIASVRKRSTEDDSNGNYKMFQYPTTVSHSNIHHFKRFTVATSIGVANDHGYLPLVVNTSRYFPHS